MPLRRCWVQESIAWPIWNGNKPPAPVGMSVRAPVWVSECCAGAEYSWFHFPCCSLGKVMWESFKFYFYCANRLISTLTITHIHTIFAELPSYSYLGEWGWNDNEIFLRGLLWTEQGATNSSVLPTLEIPCSWMSKSDPSGVRDHAVS